MKAREPVDESLQGNTLASGKPVVRTTKVDDEQDAARTLQLVEQAKEGSIAAFRELFELYHQRVFAIALSVLGNPDDAQDVVQEAFLKVHRKLNSFRGQSSFYTWLYRIVFNLSVDLSRKRYRSRELSYGDTAQLDASAPAVHEDISPRETTGTVATPEEALDRQELSQNIQKALGALSPEHRAVILLREMEGLSYSEISEVVGVSKGTVMSRLHHARRRLQKTLQDFYPWRKQHDDEERQAHGE